jgi:hypothetical protein
MNISSVVSERPALNSVSSSRRNGGGQVMAMLVLGLGPEGSKALFLHFEPGEHPKLPQGKHDDTHFSELGARRVAELAAREMARLHLPIAGLLALERLVPPPPASSRHGRPPD